MSYVVHLWEHFEPATLMAAEQMHQHLSGRPSPPNAKWRRLRDEVESRMAALGTAMIWDEEPFDIAHRERTYGLSFEGPEGFHRVLVRVATSLGFSVYDDVAAQLYLPFSRLLTADGRKRIQWVDAASVLVTPADREAVMARCEAAWRPRFEALGFTFRRDEPFRDEIPWLAEREAPVGRQTVRIGFSVFNNVLSFDVLAHVVPHLPEAVRAAAGSRQIRLRGNQYRGMAAFMKESQWGLMSVGGSLMSSEHVDRLVDALFEYLDDEILPTFDACRTADSLLRVALGDDIAPGHLLPSGLTMALAWLAGDAVLERLNALYLENERDWEQRETSHAALSALPRTLAVSAPPG